MILAVPRFGVVPLGIVPLPVMVLGQLAHAVLFAGEEK